MRIAAQSGGIQSLYSSRGRVRGALPSAMTCSGTTCTCDTANGASDCADRSACAGKTVYCTIDLATNRTKCSCTLSRFGSVGGIFTGVVPILSRL